jgi:putative Mg2+ transporter-C (MgtC) family protein
MTDAITGLGIEHPATVAVRLLAAMLAGFMVGFEREQHVQPAGLRTHMVLAMGSCMIMLVSIYLPLDFLQVCPGSDPGRLAAQVISGIGFLGAGAIFRFGFTVRGLTTAASIWTISGIGLALGAGMYFLGMLSAVLLVVILQLFDRVEERFFERKGVRILTVVINSRLLSPKQVIEIVKKFDIAIRSTSVTEDVDAGTTQIVLNCRIDEDFSIRLLFEAVKGLGNIKTIRIE